MRPNATSPRLSSGTYAIGAATGMSWAPAPGLQRGHDAEHLAVDGRTRDQHQAKLPVPVRDQVDVAGLVGYGDQTLLRELGVQPLGLPEDQARCAGIPADFRPVSIDGARVAKGRT